MSSGSKRDVTSFLEDLEFEVITPRRVDESTYDRVQKTVVECILPHGDVVSIYGDSRSPTAPGISDFDWTIVVDDDPTALDSLATEVESLLADNPYVLKHHPCLLPERLATDAYLFESYTMGLDHLAGKDLELRTDETEHSMTLLQFDQFVIEPYNRLLQQLVPRYWFDDSDRTPVTDVIRATAPFVELWTESTVLEPTHLRLDVRDVLVKTNSPSHLAAQFENAFGHAPNSNGEILEQVHEYRMTYFERDVPPRELVSLLIESLRVQHALMKEFLATQTLYECDTQTSRLRWRRPTLVTPRWHDISATELLSLFLDSGIAGRIIPPEVAGHLATLPVGEKSFFGSPPPKPVADRETAALVERRRSRIEQMIAFDRTHQIASKPFMRPPLIRRLLALDSRNQSLLNRMRRGIKERRDSVLLYAWEKRFRDV